MSWLVATPVHLQSLYLLFEAGLFLFYLRMILKNVRHFSDEEW